jgi:hypothetical protein
MRRALAAVHRVTNDQDREMRLTFRVRTLMIAVALLAGVCWTHRLWARSRYYMGRANYHIARQAQCRKEAISNRQDAQKARDWSRRNGGSDCSNWAHWAVEADELADWHGLLYAKYRHAATHPWQSVGPDPKRPQTVRDRMWLWYTSARAKRTGTVGARSVHDAP